MTCVVDKINRPSRLRRAIGFDFSYLSTSKASPNDTGIVIIIIIGEVVSVEHGRDYSTDLSFQRGRMLLVWLAGCSLGKMRGNDIREKKKMKSPIGNCLKNAYEGFISNYLLFGNAGVNFALFYCTGEPR